MERFPKIALCGVGLATALAFGAGCIHVHTDVDGKLKSIELKVPEAMEPSGAAPTGDSTKLDPAVKQAGATGPAPAAGLSLPSFGKLTGKGDAPKGAANDLMVAWQNRIFALPDPTRNGQLGQGLVGQMFLFGPGYQPAPVAGKLTIEMFDDTPRPGISGESRRIGSWTYDKETLRKLTTMDERFGKSYALFLPWPDYKPDIAKVRLLTRYDPDQGHPLFAPATPLTIDTTPPGTPTQSTGFSYGPPGTTGAMPAAGFMGAPPMSMQPPGAVPPLNPLPIGGGPFSSGVRASPPSNMPPIAFTVPTRP